MTDKPHSPSIEHWALLALIGLLVSGIGPHDRRTWVLETPPVVPRW